MPSPMIPLPRRDFVRALSYLSVFGGLVPSGQVLAAAGRASRHGLRKNVDAIIDGRLAAAMDADAFASVLEANPAIARRQPGIAALYRQALQDAATLAFFEQRRVKALTRLKGADFDPRLKLVMLDLQLEKVDHSVAMCMDHFIGVYELLRGWGHADELAVVGLFHAVYGTEFNVIDLLDYRSSVDRHRLRRHVGFTTERWIALYGLMEACDFVVGARNSGGAPGKLRFFESTNAISNQISERDFEVLAELQVANAYEPFTSSGQTADLGIARKFTFIRPFVSAGAQSALDEVLRVFPDNSDADVGCVTPPPMSGA